MAKYGQAALDAVRLLGENPEITPQEAWDIAICRAFPHRAASQKKSCPRSTFLGLCEAGVVRGVAPGLYTRSVLNKEYALQGLEALRRSPGLVDDIPQLWAQATDFAGLRHNAQMEVLTVLWTEDYLG